MSQEIIKNLGYSIKFADKVMGVKNAEAIIDSLKQITKILNEDNTKKLSQKDIESIFNGYSRCSKRAQRVATYLKSALTSSANFTTEQIIILFSMIQSEAALKKIINKYKKITGDDDPKSVQKFSFENIIAIGKGADPSYSLTLIQKNRVKLLKYYSPDDLINRLLNPYGLHMSMLKRIVDLLKTCKRPRRTTSQFSEFGAQSGSNDRNQPYTVRTTGPQSSPLSQAFNYPPALPAYPQTPILTSLPNPTVSIAQNYPGVVPAMMLWPHSQSQYVTQAPPVFYLQAASPAEPQVPAPQFSLPVYVPTPVPAATVSGNRAGFFNEQPTVQTTPPIQLPSINTLLKEVDEKIKQAYLNRQRTIFKEPEFRPEMTPVKPPQQNIGQG